ncbi:hypothetical protein KR018_001002, partial [Drosophila ironensis]
RLYNFLTKLTSHRWIWCEFVESYLDKPIMAIAYDMDRFIKECCPQIKTRLMPRRGWQLLRRNMGKARRFSPAFIELEREELERTRRIVRELQQSRFNAREDGPYMEQIPKRIPLPLTVGTKVTTFLQGNGYSGICEGKILSFNVSNTVYQVRFELGCKETVLSLPDYRLKAEQYVPALPLIVMLNSIEKAAKNATDSQDKEKDEDMDKDNEKAKEEVKFGNNRYSRKLLESLVKVKKLMEIKQRAVLEIAQINTNFVEGGQQWVLGSNSSTSSNRRDHKITPQREKLQRRYAANMITLHRINNDLLPPIKIIHDHLATHYYQQQDQIAKCRSTCDIFLKCRNQAEMDLRAAEVEKSLKVESESTRNLLFDLQTLLYITGELGHENHSDMELVMNDVVARLVEQQPPEVGQHFNQMWQSLEPLRLRMVSTFKLEKKPKRAPFAHQVQLPKDEKLFPSAPEAQLPAPP